jgi:hypothetical protein
MDRSDQLAHPRFDILDDQRHRSGAVDHQHYIEPLTPQFQKVTGEAVPNAVAIATADSSAAVNSNPIARRRADVVIENGHAIGVGRYRRCTESHRFELRHRYFRNVEVIHFAAATTTAAGRQRQQGEFAGAALMHRDNEKQQQKNVQRDRKRDRPTDEAQSAAQEAITLC